MYIYNIPCECKEATWQTSEKRILEHKQNIEKNNKTILRLVIIYFKKGTRLVDQRQA